MPDITSEELARLRAIEAIATRLVSDPLWGIRPPDASDADQLLDLLLPGEAARRRQDMTDAMRAIRRPAEDGPQEPSKG